MKPALQINNKDFEVDLETLDDSQRKSVESEAKNVLIRASAGSGKTKTLTTAISAYRYENLNDRICAITYTRAAKAEMESRLQALGIYDVEVTTIHSWARKMLEVFSKRYDFKIRILEERDIKEILTDLTKEYLRKSKVKSVNINILYTFISGSKKMDITDNYRRTLIALEERYIAYKRRNMLYDFTDYPLYLYNIMTLYNERITNIDALFVDEFQDVDTTQFEIFEKVDAKKKFFIGDEKQSIYIFRNADGEVFDKLNDFELYNLKYNYRSYQEIINYASAVYDKLSTEELLNGEPVSYYITMIMNAAVECDINCARGYGGDVYISNPFADTRHFKGLDYEIVNIVDCFEEFIKKKPMILCRTNKQVKALQEMGYLNTSTIHQAKGLEYDNVIVVDTEIATLEDLNVAYVALTRAKDGLFVLNWPQLESLLRRITTRGLI